MTFLETQTYEATQEISSKRTATRAGLQGRRTRGNFYWRAPMT